VGTYVDLDGVRTWYDEAGQGAPLVVLHPGLVDARALAAGDLAVVTCRALVMVADDEQVTLEHAVEFYRALPDGELAVVPGTSHGLLVEKPELCHRILLDFLAGDPVPTLAPIRRRPGR
jgi:fermentation-respiration switch protein FrsA (DUF1100 family)